MIAALACMSVVLTIPKPVLNFDKLIAAIEAVESPNERDPWAKAGGAANFKPALWMQYSALNYSYSQVPYWSHEAMKHAFADWIERYHALDITATNYRLAAAWNLGFRGALHAVRTETCFGSRVANLCEAKP